MNKIVKYEKAKEGFIIPPELEDWVEQQERAMELHNIENRMREYESIVGKEKAQEVFRKKYEELKRFELADTKQ